MGAGRGKGLQNYVKRLTGRANRKSRLALSLFRTVTYKSLAEREGFEPPIPVKVWPLSRRLVSTTHAPLRAARPAVVVRTG